MARSLFELGFIVALVDHATAPLRAIEHGFERIHGAALRMRGLRDAGESMKRVGMEFMTVGAEMGAALYELVEASIESTHQVKMLQTQLHLTDAAIREIDEASIAFSNHMVGSEEAYKTVAGVMQQITHETEDMRDTMASTATVMGIATRMNVDYDTAATFVMRAFSAMGNAAKPVGPQVKAIGDILEATKAHFKLDLGSTLVGLGKIAPLATAMNVPFSELMTILGGLQKLGPRAAMQFGSAMAQILADTKKLQPLGVTIKPGMGFLDILEQVRARTAGMEQMAATAMIEKAFSGAGPLILDLTRHLDEYRRQTDEAQRSTGMLNRDLERMRTEDAATAITVLRQALHNTREVIGDTVVAIIGPFADSLTKALMRVQELSKSHPTVVKLGLAFLALGTATLVPLGAMLFLTGQLVIMLAYGPAALVSLRLLAGGFIGFAAGALRAAAASAVFLATNPVGWVILAAAALAAGTYAYIKYYDEIVHASVRAQNWLVNHVSMWYDAGVAMIKALGRGIADGVLWPVHAAEDVAEKVADYFVGHSPPPVGPLRELANVRIMETIAEHMSPAPVVAAARRAAGAISIHYAPTINNAGEQQGSLRTMLDEHFKQLASMLANAQQRQERTAY